MIRVIAPAKVNLHLSVGSLLPDGYHALTSIFHVLDLADEIDLEPAAGLHLECDEDLGIADRDNLVHRAARAMETHFGRRADVRIRLSKRIPHGAGMGGGSSDAAAVICGLSAMWGIETGDPGLIQVARSLGADVPFFLCEGGAALMTGRGDRIAKVLPALAGVPVAVVRPHTPVPTALAYRTFDADPSPGRSADLMTAAIESGDAAGVARDLFNNLERAAIAVVPEVAQALAWIRGREGVGGATVSGSGSAVFALCKDAESAVRVERDARASTPWWATSTALGSRGVHILAD